MTEPPSLIEQTRRLCRPTTFIESEKLNDWLGFEVILVSETFQHTGSFKFRAAVASALASGASHLLTASSGNYGQALARACQLTGKKCTIVMPETAARIKIEAVRKYGATLSLVDTSRETRADRVEQLAATIDDVEKLSAYDDSRVITGNSTLGEEIAQHHGKSNNGGQVVVPVGGGGLMAGIITGLATSKSELTVLGAEPALADDACRSLAAGRLIANDSEPQTIADGARTLSLGRLNFDILRQSRSVIETVSEEAISEATKALFFLANLKAEPTGALALAAVKANAERFCRSSTYVVISGGNVDGAAYTSIIA